MGVYIDGQLCSDTYLVVKQWMTEYQALNNTCHASSDHYISGTVSYHPQVMSNTTENTMLNESISYKEVDYAINNLKLNNSIRIDNIPNEILKNDNMRLYLYYLFCVCF